ncbi:YeiH family protein [Flavobacterium sp. '19STA2R22 D10 B1']|uniref:YeiH family protein n=1 Tax=Flavobacterium aerium TaxID=3037261 RepID=UPI00278C0C17|nr:putative sulfate exporter family transporter [Flavobacterium sp. '19STA2R22 D10 B1']
MKNTPKGFFILGIILCLFPFVNSVIALSLGILYALFFVNPYENFTNKSTNLLLKISIVGLGFGMNIHEALKVGKEGLFLTIFSIALTLTLGYFLGKKFNIQGKTAFLISVGTAICGGSAIAAIAPLLKIKQDQISLALGIVFLLNAVALFLFPVIGHFFMLSENQFGIWAAIAIHDTSSVIGAASQYGDEALKIATTVKLSRALWIIPLALVTSYKMRSEQKIQIPYFILFFILAILFNSYYPIPALTSVLTFLSKKGLVVVLFLIGTKLTLATIKKTGFKIFAYGLSIWVCIAAVSLWIICQTNN